MDIWANDIWAIMTFETRIFGAQFREAAYHIGKCFILAQLLIHIVLGEGRSREQESCHKILLLEVLQVLQD